MLIRTMLLVLLLAGGCTRMRFVVEAVPAEDEMTETEVLRDEGAKRSDPKIVLIDVTGLIVDAQRPVLRRHGLERRAHRLVGPGGYGVGPDADLAHPFGEV
ncbi:MAG: hypothetical protein ACYS1E_18785, partial [Planctomycetota bacterium]